VHHSAINSTSQSPSLIIESKLSAFSSITALLLLEEEVDIEKSVAKKTKLKFFFIFLKIFCVDLVLRYFWCNQSFLSSAPVFLSVFGSAKISRKKIIDYTFSIFWKGKVRNETLYFCGQNTDVG